MRNKYVVPVNMNREALLGTKYNQMTPEKKLNEARKVGKHKKEGRHPATKDQNRVADPFYFNVDPDPSLHFKGTVA
jgi:hypothetical protein